MPGAVCHAPRGRATRLDASVASDKIWGGSNAAAASIGEMATERIAGRSLFAPKDSSAVVLRSARETASTAVTRTSYRNFAIAGCRCEPDRAQILPTSWRTPGATQRLFSKARPVSRKDQPAK